jgi:hypothetical protein
MKVSELIKELQELDPNDECQVCVGNSPLRWVERLPWYYDGRMTFIEYDTRSIPIKGGYPNHGSKIMFHYDTLEDALMDNPDMELDLSGITYQGKVEERYAKMIDKWIQQGREFQDWKKKYAAAYELGKQYWPNVSFRTRLTNWLRRLGVID